MEISFPKNGGDTIANTKVNDSLSVTILLDGNKSGKVYYYEGKFDGKTWITETTLDSGLIKYTMNKNAETVLAMNKIRLQHKNGEISDTVFKTKKTELLSAHSPNTPFFIVKWGGNAKYAAVIDVLDLLQKCDVNKYALTPISKNELMALSKITGTHYPELDEIDTTQIH
jgi:hypothetical protein